jgi:hypothetical protein
MEAHVRTCPSCREELDRLRLTEAALFALRDEEIPQRIAFVSDPVFEPSPWRCWASAFWGSSARLGFASVAMLSIALVVFAVTRPAPAPAVVAPAPVATASLSSSEVQAQIQAAVDKAVRESEARQQQKTERLVADVEGRAAQERQRIVQWADAWVYQEQQRNNRIRVASGSYGPPVRGGAEVVQ